MILKVIIHEGTVLPSATLLFSRSDRLQQVGDVDVQGGGQTLHVVDRDVARCALHLTDKRAVQTGLISQLRLRESFCGSNRFQTPGQPLPSWFNSPGCTHDQCAASYGCRVQV